MPIQSISEFKKKRMRKLQESNTLGNIYSSFSMNDDYEDYYQEMGVDRNHHIFIEGILNEMQQNINDNYYSKPNRVIKVGEYRILDQNCYI